MNIRLLSLGMILGLLGFASPLRADDKPASKPKAAAENAKDGTEAEKEKKPLPDYIRFKDDEKSARLEIAIKTFKLPSGALVDLIGVVHIADAAYYADLNKRFDSYDAVLFELVGDPRAVTDKEEAQAEREGKGGGGAIRWIQTTAGKFLKLSFQLGQIDYTKPNMVHADASAEEFAKMQEERGESMLKLFIRAMKAQMSGDLSGLPVDELDTFGLIRILMSKDSAAEFKIVLAKMFDQAESMTKILEGDEGSAILTGRNEVVMKKIKEVLRDKSKKRISVFYGAAHMPGIEGMLLKDMKAAPAGEEWLAGWTMPHDPPAKKEEKKDGEKKEEEKKP
ncbi:MAG TPA: TraB/GumN family protein [Verrucomicrobiales bacterium]|nr:TraB/GumN family protein [Verrucomicrobiales bacterium]